MVRGSAARTSFMAAGVSARAAALMTLATSALWITACAPKSEQTPSITGAQQTPEQLEEESEAAAKLFGELITRQNERVSRLGTFESRASLELRYSDRDGAHFDQCEADIFLTHGARGALRATKVGSNLLWVGSDGTRGWVFRLDKDPTSLTIFDSVETRVLGQALEGDGALIFTMLAPSSVRALSGMQALPEGASLLRVAEVPETAPLVERFELEYQPFKGLTARMRFGTDGLPSSIRVLDRKGGLLLHAKLSEYERARAENIAQGAWPQVARRIEVDFEVEKFNARIFLDAPVAMGKRMKPRFFVLEELIAQLHPDSIAHVLRPTATSDADPGSSTGTNP